MNISKNVLAGIFCLMAGVPAFSAVVDFTYAEGEESRFGTRKTENYDVAIRLYAPGFVGNKITAIKVPVCESGISDVRLWLSKELKIETVDGKRVNVPDVVEVSAHVENGVASVTLDDAYTITDAGIYVGYSFNLDELTDETEYPLLVAQGTNPDGLYMHTERSYRKWVPFAEEFQLCSRLSVTLETPDMENAAGISVLPVTRAMVNEPFDQQVVIANHGKQPIGSVDYTYEIAGKTGNGSHVFDVPVPASYNSKGAFDITMPAVSDKGQIELAVKITKVNGVDNPDANASAKGYVNVLSVVPVHRAVMEEYTGTWCGYCVRGFAAMERLNSLYKEDFIGLAYHNKDPMAVTSSYPSSVSGFPYSYIDRAVGCDPYYGEPVADFGIEATWLGRCAELTPAAVDVKAEFTGANAIEVKSYTTFIEVPRSSYAMAYYIVEDGMTGKTSGWRQNNYFSDQRQGSAEEFIPEMEKFVNGDDPMRGLKFDDVVVMMSNMKGVAGSLDGIKVDEEFEHTFTFEAIDQAFNQYGDPVIQDKTKLRAVVLLIDTETGYIVNAAKTGYITGTGVESILENPEVVATEYYDLTGRRIMKPEKGIFIKAERRSDGSVKSTKVVF